jgi:hypothetical protein
MSALELLPLPGLAAQVSQNNHHDSEDQGGAYQKPQLLAKALNKISRRISNAHSADIQGYECQRGYQAKQDRRSQRPL